MKETNSGRPSSCEVPIRIDSAVISSGRDVFARWRQSVPLDQAQWGMPPSLERVSHSWLCVAKLVPKRSRQWWATVYAAAHHLVCQMILVLVVLIGHGQCLIEDGEALGDDVVGGVQRRQHMNAVEVRKDYQPELLALSNNFVHLGRITTIRCQRLLRFAILDKLHCPKTAHPADITDGRVAFFDAFKFRANNLITQS